VESKARGPIGKAVDKAVAYLTEHPDEARYTDSMARAVVVEGLRCRVEGPTGETLETDMPTGIGGGGAAPSPGWFLRAAVASCVASLAAIRAAQLGVALSRTEVEVDSESDDRGILGISAEVRAGPLSSRITVRLAADRSTQTRQLEAIGRWAVDHCPVSDALRRAIPLETRFERI
jgi:uncharacterized OsmC-like protein